MLKLIAAHTNTPIYELNLQNTLFGDLGIDGDDAVTLMDEFMNIFQIDSKEYHHEAHFGMEGLWPWFPMKWLSVIWYKWYKGKTTPEELAGYLPIKVQDLINSAKSKKWTIQYTNFH